MSLILDGTNGETFPSWTTATRPASPVVGQMGYNTTTGNYDAYTASGWTSVITSTTAQGSTAGSVIANGPAFSVYNNTTQALSSVTLTLTQYQTKEFDTASAFNNTGSTVGSAPAYSFNPQVAGYYQLNSIVSIGTTVNTGYCALYKNGSVFKYAQLSTATNFGMTIQANFIVYLNGSTDYVQIYTYITTGTNINNGSTNTIFSGSLIRAA